METVVIAIGSNLGERLKTIQKAGDFLEELSESEIQKASIWESEPVGPAKFTFLNTVARIRTSLPPKKLLKKLKEFEQMAGREKNPERWGPRLIDLDIIRYGSLVIQAESLIIPHQEYSRRLFVLLPMQEIDAEWLDPTLKLSISEMVQRAPDMQIHQTEYNW